MAAAVEVGSRIGAYRIEGELGRGGMGHVFVAEHVSLGRKAALKLLAPGLAADPAFHERLVHESQLIAAIEHPNMIPIYDAGEADGVLFIAMRYVEGYDLRTLIDRDGGLEPELALEIVGQAAAALDAAHARDIVHRDVKPENILIDVPTDRAYLTDFGIAKRARTGTTEEGVFVGTVDYAAPEQIQGEETGPAADVYALGCVLYHALTGERPFPKDTDVAVLYAHLLDAPPRVTGVRPELPEALDDVVAHALAKSPAERFGSCAELVAAAANALRGAAPVAAAAAPALAAGPAAERDRTNLPSAAGRLVGRDDDLAALVAAVRDEAARLVTLTGPGGTGKTRLALEVGGAAAEAFGHGVCFVGLAATNDPALVLSAVAQALGVEEGAQPDERVGGGGALDILATQLQGERLLVILDNFEHVLPAAADVADLLAALPLLTVLATSRAPLRVRGEREHAVAPLELPDPDGRIDAAALAASPAVALFAERAAEVRPGFALTDENAAAVVEICRRLDGLPLAIELAAARVRLMEPEAVAARLENRLQLLTGGARDLPSRHQTLRGTIDWSHELLDDAGRALLARASVFVGGFTLEAVEQVCAGGELDAPAVLDALEALVDESLLQRREGADGSARFAMLETVREYALFRLIERREADELRARHAQWVAELAETAEPELVGPRQAEWLRRLDDETGNVRAALAWSLDAGDLAGLRVAAALFRLWSSRGQLAEGRRWLDRALAATSGPPVELHAKALFAAGYSALGLGDLQDAVARFEQSLDAYAALGDDGGRARCLAQLGWLMTARGDLAAGVARSEESLALAREAGDARTMSLALVNLGDAASAAGDHARAAELTIEALAARRAVGDVRIVADALLRAGRARLLAGDAGEAGRLLEEGLALARELGDGWTTSVALESLAVRALLAGDLRAAGELLGDALATAQKRGDKRLVAECLECSAAAAAAAGDARRAAVLWGAAAAVRDEAGAAASAVERYLQERYRPDVGEALSRT